MIAGVRARLQKRLHGDQGFTMVEMLVGMLVMTIFMTIFTTSMIAVFNSTNKAQAVSDSSGQLNVAFDKLDVELRYASYIGAPAQDGTTGYWTVAFQTTNTGSPVCTQLRVNSSNQQIQQRTWNVLGSAPNTTASGLTAWAPLASEIVNGAAASGSATQPFVRTIASPSVPSTQLQVYLVSTSGNGIGAATSTSNVTYVALNTNLTTPTSGLCGEVTSQ